MDLLHRLLRARRRPSSRATLGSPAAALLLLLAAPAAAAASGTVFVDLNRNGVRDSGEPPRASVAVSNGLDVVRTGADGRYALAEGPRGLVFVTRPAGFECARWYRRGPGDFALTPTPAAEAFFFVQMTDLHVYDRASELIAEFGLGDPWWAPSRLVAWITLRRIEKMLVPRFSLDPVEDLRRALAPYREVGDLGDTAVYLAYRDEFQREGSEIGDVRGQIAAALAEIAALQPAFVVATGDLVLDANRAPEAAVRRRVELYRSATASMGVPVHHTIGNHELYGVGREEVDERDPDYGIGLFEAGFGPSYYSFDRGDFHFVALDTHRPDPSQEETDGWRWNRMRDEVKRWLRRDLEAHRDRVKVVLNHEPFFAHPSWPFDEEELERYVVPDEGILAEHAVAYTLSGHVHLGGVERGGTTTHISAGALFGMGWYLPPSLYPRGYRLFYARDGRLFTAWKEIGEPLLGFVQPQGAESIQPASTARIEAEALAGAFDLVAVAADAQGPFAALSLELDGQPLRFERWGDYFLGARFDPAELRGESATLTLSGTRASGETLRTRLAIRARN